jgi:hypothetical protein
MATTTKTRARKPASTRKATTTARAATRKTATARRSTASTTTSTRPKNPVEQAQLIAERAVLVPVGASLLARDNLVTTVRGLTTRYRTRTGFEREIKRFERRGVTARNRFERQVRRTRTKFERELRQRRNRVERTVMQNQRRIERDLRSVGKDIGRQSGTLTARVEKLVSEAQGRLG